MSLREDPYGIVSRNEALRLRYGNRVTHGKVATPPPPPPGVLAATVNPFERPKPKAVANVFAWRKAVPAAVQGATVLPPKPIPPGLTPAVILAVVANVTGVSVVDMKSRSQKRPISRPRQFAYWLLRGRLGLSRNAAGRLMGGKDGTSARAGAIKTGERIEAGDPEFVRWRDEAVAMLDRVEARCEPCQQEQTPADGKSSPRSTG